MPLKIYPIKADAKGHRTRYSDSSFYDEVCVTCGATDAGTALNGTCPNQVTDEEHAAERLKTAQYQLRGEMSTMVRMIRETAPKQVNDFWTKYLDKIADALELAEEDRAKPGYDQGHKDGEGSMMADFQAAFDGIVDSFTGPQDLAKQIEDKLSKLTVPMTVNPHVTVVVNGEGPEAEAAYQEMMAAGFGKHFEIQRTNKKSALKPTIETPKVDVDATIDQHALDQADAIDFGTTYKAVKMAREAYEGEQAKTRLFFMADWNKLARFKRRELARAKM